MRKFLSSVVIATSFFINFLPALAQTAPAKKLPALTELTPEEEANLFPTLPEQTVIPNTTTCFDDYRFGSVQTDISPVVLSTVPGVPITFSGKIKNDNPYPIVDGSVYVKIFKKQKTHSNTDLNTKQNGPELVDQFFAKENISIKAQGSEPILFVWNVPRNAESGDYQAATYFVTAKRFNLSGLSFTDDVTGNKVDFSIKSDVINPPAYFNKNTVTLNQQPHKFAIFPLHFPKEENVTAEVELVNPSKQDKTIQLTWKLYKWDGLREENKKDEKTETITLKASETKKLSYTINKDTGSVAYLVAEVRDGAMKSILDIRFVREGIEEIRLNFPSITSYPLTQGQENSLFSCVHSTSSPIVKDNTLTLTLKTLSGETIHKYTYQGDISGEMMGVKEAFTPKQTVKNFTLTATLKNKGNTIEEVTQTYLCNKLGDNCPKEITSSSQPSDFLDFGEKDMWLKLVLFLAGAAVLFFVIRKIVMKRSNSTFSFFFALIIASSLLFGLGGVERAEGQEKDEPVYQQVNGWLYYVWSYADSIGDEISTRIHPPLPGLNSPNITVHYRAKATDVSGNVFTNGASVPVGSQIKFRFEPHDNGDIEWFSTGYSADSPYGRWIVNANAPPISPLGRMQPWMNILGVWREKHVCDEYDYIGDEHNGWHGNWYIKVYIPLSVNPPTKQPISVSPNLNCGTGIPDANGYVTCSVTGKGPITADMTYNSTYARFYHRQYDPRVVARTNFIAGCYGTNIPMDPSIDNLYSNSPLFTIPIPAATIPFTFNAVQANNGPALTVTSPNQTGGSGLISDPLVVSGTSNNLINFTAKATDPEDDQVRYEFHWVNDIAYEPKPAVGFVNSGEEQTGSYQWPANAQAYVVAKDDSNNPSNNVYIQINIAANQPPNKPTITNTFNNQGLPGVNYSFTATTTDPESNQLRYGFDWDNDAVINPITGVVTGIDEWTNYVSSGTSQSLSRGGNGWPRGTHTFQVLAQDDQGVNHNSPLETHTFTIRCPQSDTTTDCICSNEKKTHTVVGDDPGNLYACINNSTELDCTSSEKNSCRDFNFREVAP